MNVGSALKLSCVGMAGGIVIRVISLLYFFDYGTGFYSNPFIAWCDVGFIFLVSLLCAIWCTRDARTHFGVYVPRRNIFSGITALISGVVLILVGVVQLREYRLYVQQGRIETYIYQSSNVHLIFIICSFAYGALQLFTAGNFFAGKNLYQKMRALYLISVAWGIAYLYFVFVFCAKSALVVENAYMIIGAAGMLLCLLYISKILAGIGGERVAKRCFCVGFFAVSLNVSYVVANFIVSLLGYDCEMFDAVPLPIEGAVVSISIFLLSFLFTFKKYSISRKPRQSYANGRTKERGKRRFRAQ